LRSTPRLDGGGSFSSREIVTILTYAERQRYWNWCREFIDREAIYRADDTHPATGANDDDI
jgi:hypothetical protein